MSSEQSYADIVAQYSEEKLRQSMQQAVDKQPDAEATIQSLAKQYNLPPESVRLQKPEVERRTKLDGMDYKSIVENYANTANFMSDPDNAALAHDDYDSLVAHEALFAKPKRGLIEDTFVGVASTGLKAYGAWDKAAVALSDIMPEGTIGKMSPEERAFYLERGRFHQEVGLENAPQRITGQVTAGLAYAPFMAAAPLVVGATEGTARTQELEQLGVDPETARKAGTAEGALQALLQFVPMGKVKFGEGLKPLLTSSGLATVKAGAVGASQALISDTVASSLLKDKGYTQLAEQFSPTLDKTLASAAFMSGLHLGMQGVHAATGGAAKLPPNIAETSAFHNASVTLREKLALAAKSHESARKLEELNALAAANKLRERDGGKYEEFVDKLAEDGEIKDVYINPKDLAQAGIDPNELVKVSPSAAEQYATAEATGGDIKIPISEYASRIASTDLGTSLLDHVRTDPLDFTRAQAKEYMQSAGEQLKAEVEKVLAGKKLDDKFLESKQVVHDEVLKQLTEANRFTKDVNEPYAGLMSSFYAVQAARLGITPEEMFARHPIKIQAEYPVAPGAELNRALNQTEREAPQGTDVKREVILSQDSAVSSLPANTFSDHISTLYGADIALHDTPFGLHLAALKVPEQEREKGIGTEVMKQITAYADANNKKLVLTPSGDFGGSVKRLEKFYKRFGFVENKGKNKDFGTRERFIREPQVLNQNTTGKRGSFNPYTNTITLLKAADLSTFLHESGHFFLETMNKLALDPNAPPEIKADMEATLKWLGVEGKNTEERLAAWNAMSLEEQRHYHEQFARGFEAYLFEGKAPSVEMRGVFQRFRAWLLSVYRNIRNLDVELSDDVRGVFDRMLATSDQIKEAEALRGMEPIFKTPAEAGMTDDEFKAYHDLGVQASQEAITNLEARSLRDMKWLSNAKGKELKRLQTEAEEKRKAIRREVTDEVMGEPVNQARTFLKRGIDPATGEPVEGGFKLYIPEIEAMYGDTPMYRAITEKLGYGKYGMLGVENGVHPDQVAEMFGFTSGDHLVRELISAENPREKIAALTDQRMLERYGDLTDQQSMERAAEEAIHNEARTRFVAAELNALQKATGGRKILAEAAKQFAEATISRLKIRDLNPNRYTAAEARAAKNSDKALASGDLAEAAKEKRNQLVQNYAARAAFNAQGEIEKAVRYLQKFEREGTRKNISTDYIEQIDALLDRFDLRKSVSLKAIERRKSLVDWVAKQQEVGIEPEIPPEMLNEANRKHYKDMTVEEMRGLRDTVKQIEHIGRLKEKLLTAKDNREFAATVEGIVKSINENAGDKRVDNRTRANAADRAVRLFKGFVASHRKISSLVRELDGFKDAGPMWDTFVRSMNDAGNKEAVMREQATVKLAELIKPILAGDKLGGKGIYFESIGKSLNREERLGIALNMGNAGNVQRLLDGEGWTLDQLRPVLDSLTKQDWDFVQSTWDFFESYRPEIAAKEKRIYGKEPEWVEPNVVNTKFGEYRGGYYPIKYDARRSAAAEQHADAELAKQQMKGAYTSATTRRSFTKARADEVKGRPLLYSMDGLYAGINEVIHDLSWHEWLIDANRLLRNKSLDNAIRTRYGADVMAQLKNGVRDIAAGEMPRGDALEKVLGNLRSGATIAGLGFNIMNSVINLTGATQSIVRVGPKWFAMGVAEWSGSPMGLLNTISEKSDFMRLRSKTMQRELNEIQSRVRGKSSARAVADRLMFMPMTMTQIAVDTPTWWGAYQKALSEGHEENKAVALADQAVLDTQGGGQMKDLSAIQRGHPALKLFTAFYSYFNTAYNLGVERTKATNFKDPLSVLKLGGDYLMLYSVPAVLGTLIKQALVGGDDDPEKLAKKLANDQLSYLFGLMVGVRELAGAAQMAAGVSEFNTGYGGPAGLRFVSDFYKLAQQIHQGEADDALRRSAINVAGVVFHLPAAQMNRTIDGIAALSEGKTKNPLAVLVGAPPKK